MRRILLTAACPASFLSLCSRLRYSPFSPVVRILVYRKILCIEMGLIICTGILYLAFLRTGGVFGNHAALPGMVIGVLRQFLGFGMLLIILTCKGFFTHFAARRFLSHLSRIPVMPCSHNYGIRFTHFCCTVCVGENLITRVFAITTYPVFYIAILCACRFRSRNLSQLVYMLKRRNIS